MMMRTLGRMRSTRILTLGALLMFASGLAFSQEEASGDRSDGQIEMDVVHVLDGSQALQNDMITAATIQGEVTLSGTVASDSSRRLAEQLVAKVHGVARVNNKLKVGDPQQAAEAENLTLTPQSQSASTDPELAAQQNYQANPSNSAGQSYGQGSSTAPQARPSYNGQASASAGMNSQQGQPAQQDAYPQQAYPQQQQSQQQYPQQQYPQQQQQQPAAPEGYAAMVVPQQAYRLAPAPLTVPQGTLLVLRTRETIQSKQVQEGAPVEFIVMSDVNAGGYLAIPRGATVHGVISQVKNVARGELTGSPSLSVQLTALELGGMSYPLQSDEFRVKGPGKGGRTAGSALGGALLGAIIGGAAGGGSGAAIGAGIGAGAGTAASAASNGPGVWIPAEARVDFHLMAPLTVNAVSQQEALRLSQGLTPGGPTLYRRNPGPGSYGQPTYYSPYGNGPYGPPPVYYRPYTVVGGYGYWR